MNKLVIYLWIVICFSITVSAYYGGNSIYYDFSEYENIENISYEYTGGLYNYDGLVMSVYSSSATLHIPINYREDNFSVIFEIVTRVETEEEDDDDSGGSSGGGSSGGGSSSTTTVTRVEYVEDECESTWECSEWSVCFNKTQNRDCKIINNECNKTVEIPDLVKGCIEDNIISINNSEIIEVGEDKIDSGFHKIFSWIFGGLLVLLLIVIYLVYGDNIKKFRIFKAVSKFQKL